jgi:hypothetical protein
MNVVHLPMLTALTSLKDAVRAMRIQQRSAVLRETGVNVDLIAVPKIFSALGHKLTELSNVPASVTDPVHVLSPADVSTWNLDTRDPLNTEIEYENFLDSINRSYTLLDWVSGTGLIVTRHEHQGDDISLSPKDCYCLGPFEHSYPPPPVSSGGSCPQCGNTVHCE